MSLYQPSDPVRSALLRDARAAMVGETLSGLLDR